MREMHVHGRLAEAMRLRIAVGEENVPLHANRGAARKFRLGLHWTASLLERRLVGLDVGLGDRRRSQSDKVQPLLAGPSRADFIRGAIPKRRMRLHEGAPLNRI